MLLLPTYQPTFVAVSYSPQNLIIAGMDILKHGESAYPVDAWIELQYGGGAGGADGNGHLVTRPPRKVMQRSLCKLIAGGVI